MPNCFHTFQSKVFPISTPNIKVEVDSALNLKVFPRRLWLAISLLLLPASVYKEIKRNYQLVTPLLYWIQCILPENFLKVCSSFNFPELSAFIQLTILTLITFQLWWKSLSFAAFSCVSFLLLDPAPFIDYLSKINSLFCNLNTKFYKISLKKSVNQRNSFFNFLTVRRFSLRWCIQLWLTLRFLPYINTS